VWGFDFDVGVDFNFGGKFLIGVGGICRLPDGMYWCFYEFSFRYFFYI